ncbi:hypothetical protein FA13DRAFT_1038212 [Coprinellus micaceus]|uniref:Uncharacterized protein n=1 Tax=Coprinellus micaceus TaxID=71717 RepID=A0A4Y7SXL2_COPMI|nr:hypothetical protein FA13DRAFT_1038212 [Coprinellus micaceus]
MRERRIRFLLNHHHHPRTRFWATCSRNSPTLRRILRTKQQTLPHALACLLSSVDRAHSMQPPPAAVVPCIFRRVHIPRRQPKPSPHPLTGYHPPGHNGALYDAWTLLQLSRRSSTSSRLRAAVGEGNSSFIFPLAPPSHPRLLPRIDLARRVSISPHPIHQFPPRIKT